MRSKSNDQAAPSAPDARAVFAVAVRARRRQLGLTQQELAGRAGLHRTYITDIERAARNLSLLSIERLAEALQVPITRLFASSESASPDGSGSSGGDADVDILLAGHDPGEVERTRQAFQAARMQNRVHSVPDGAAAMDFLFQQDACARSWTSRRALVVLLDLSLPKLGGLAVLRLIRGDARTRTLPVVMLTTADQGRDLAECRRLGCAHHLIKPVSFENFSRITAGLHLGWTLTQCPQPGGASALGVRSCSDPPAGGAGGGGGGTPPRLVVPVVLHGAESEERRRAVGSSAGVTSDASLSS